MKTTKTTNELIIECDDCGLNTLNDGLTYVESNDSHVCDDCLYTHYFTCDDCGELFHVDDQYNSYDDNTYCQDCGEEKKKQQLGGN